MTGRSGLSGLNALNDLNDLSGLNGLNDLNALSALSDLNDPNPLKDDAKRGPGIRPPPKTEPLSRRHRRTSPTAALTTTIFLICNLCGHPQVFCRVAAA